MKFKPRGMLHGMAGAYMLLASLAGAQTPSTPASPSTPDTAAPVAPAAAPAAPVWSIGSIDLSGYVDVYYDYNANRPSNEINQLYNFDDYANQFSLEAAKLTLNHDPDPVGAHVDILFGRTQTDIHNANPAGTAEPLIDNYIEQAYISVKPPKAKGFEMDLGQFATSAGDEVIETMSNWSYSHGLLFTNAIPYYHFGLRTSMPVSKTLTLGAQLVNGWNNVVANNGGVTGAFTSSFVKPKYTWNVNYYVGPEPETAGKGMAPGGTTGNLSGQNVIRNLFDTTLLLTPNAKFNAYINYDYGQNRNSAYSYYSPSGTIKVPKVSQHWQGVAVSARGQITGNSALVARYEYFYDQGTQTGYVNPKTGLIAPQTLDEITGTYEYKWPVGLLLRAEYRRDWSDHKFFQKGAYESVTAQSTATLGLIAFFGPKR